MKNPVALSQNLADPRMMITELGQTSNMPIPAPVARAADHLAGYGHDWFVCGGWAVDLLLGRQTRDHLDVDIAVFQEDQQALRAHLSGWKLLGHDDAVAEDCPDQWDGRWLKLPAHVHAGTDTMAGTELDIQICQRTATDWVFSAEHQVTRMLDDCYGTSAWGGIPIVSPLVIIYYKALPPRWRAKPTDSPPSPRPHDEADLAALAPTLNDAQRLWLREAIAAGNPGHSWLQRL